MANQETENFLKIFVPSQKRIFSYIATLIPNYADAEDIMQEVIGLLWRKFPEYTPQTDFIAWALTIARYKVYEYYKEVKRGRRKLSNETLRVLEKESAAAGESYDLHLEAVKKCVRKLENKDYKLVQLRYELNESVKHIASRFGCSVQSIYKSLARIHGILLRCVNRQLNGEGLS
jgi:RNA polymerase sigma-70 factor (ECF subfamily)